MMSRDRDEPARFQATQSRSFAWTGYNPTVRELRSWLDKVPDQATIAIVVADFQASSYSINAIWEVSP